jgi:hypothetical protein
MGLISPFRSIRIMSIQQNQLELIQSSINCVNDCKSEDFIFKKIQKAIMYILRHYHQNPFVYLIQLANYAESKQLSVGKKQELLKAIHLYGFHFNPLLTANKGGNCYDMTVLLKILLKKYYAINSQIVGSFQIEPNNFSQAQKKFLGFDHTALIYTVKKYNVYTMYYIDVGFVIREPLELQIGAKAFGMGHYTVTDIDRESFTTEFISPSGRTVYRKFFLEKISCKQVLKNQNKLVFFKRNMSFISKIDSQENIFWLRFIYSSLKFNSDMPGIPREFSLYDLSQEQIFMLQKYFYLEVFSDLKRFQSIYSKISSNFWKN